jgi:hypothetical protein
MGPTRESKRRYYLTGYIRDIVVHRVSIVLRPKHMRQVVEWTINITR